MVWRPHPNLPSTKAATVTALLRHRLLRLLVVLHLENIISAYFLWFLGVTTYTTGRSGRSRGSTVALLGVTLGRVALLRVAILAGRGTVAGLLVTVFDPS